jgi:hypothetical protein
MQTVSFACVGQKAFKNEGLMVGKGGLPRSLNATQTKRGQAALPNHEIPVLTLYVPVDLLLQFKRIKDAHCS